MTSVWTKIRKKAIDNRVITLHRKLWMLSLIDTLYVCYLSWNDLFVYVICVLLNMIMCIVFVGDQLSFQVRANVVLFTLSDFQ